MNDDASRRARTSAQASAGPEALDLAPARAAVQARAQREGRARYDGHVVVEAYPRSPDELRAWLALTDDVWSEHLTSPLVLRIAPERLPELHASALDHRVIHSELQAVIDEQAEQASRDRAPRGAWTTGSAQIRDYLDLASYEAVIDGWAAQYPDLIDLETIGESIEGRPIRALHIRGEAVTDAPVVVLLSGVHSREWLAHHALLCAVGRFIEGYGTDPEATYWLDRFEILYVPMGNPDGYDYTWTTDRLWRKNRGAEGFGVDLNRNWDAAWGTASSNDPTTQTYHGSGPFSEPETQAFSELISAHQDRVRAVLDVHAFGSAIMYPYGYTEDITDKDAEYRAVTEAMSEAMDGAYEALKLTEFVGGLSSGASADWVHDNTDTALGLGMETRGASFVEPATEIQPTCDEIHPSLFALMASLEVPDPGEGSTGAADSSGGTSEGDGSDTTGVAGSGSTSGDTTGAPPFESTGVQETGSESTTGTSGPDQTADSSPEQGCVCGIAEGRSSPGWGAWLVGMLGLRLARRRRPVLDT